MASKVETLVPSERSEELNTTFNDLDSTGQISSLNKRVTMHNDVKKCLNKLLKTSSIDIEDHKKNYCPRRSYSAVASRLKITSRSPKHKKRNEKVILDLTL